MEPGRAKLTYFAACVTIQAERDFTLKPLSEEQRRTLEAKSSDFGRGLAADRRWVSESGLSVKSPTRPR